MRKLSWNIRNKLPLAVVALGMSLSVNTAFSNQLGFERVIFLEGASNTRDIGGYVTEDLRSIRPGQIIRSEKLSRLTESDFEKLEEMGVKTVIDLRTKLEREHSPTKWKGDNPPRFYHFPVVNDNNPWLTAQSRMLKKNRFTEEQAVEHMDDLYRMIADVGPRSYRKLLDLVTDESNWPILIHCSAGKDRTGVAVALIMEAVGVDRETIMEEFLFTNVLSRSQAKSAYLAENGQSGRRKGPSAEAWFPIIGVQAGMLEEFYGSVDQEYGSMDAFLAELGIDQVARSELVEALTLEPEELAYSGNAIDQ